MTSRVAPAQSHFCSIYRAFIVAFSTASAVTTTITQFLDLITLDFTTFHLIVVDSDPKALNLHHDGH